MDPKAAFEAYLNANFSEKHEYYNDLCEWFAKGGFGFEARTLAGRRCFVEKLTYTHRAHVRYFNGRRAELSESQIEIAS